MRALLIVVAVVVMAGCSTNVGQGTETDNPVHLAGDTISLVVEMPDTPDPVTFSVWANGHAMVVDSIYGRCWPEYVVTEDADSLYYAVGGFVDWSGVEVRNSDCIYDTVTGMLSCWGAVESGDTILIP